MTESGKSAWKISGPSYLASVSDETEQKGKAFCQKNPQYRWTSRISAADLKKAAVKAGWINAAQDISSVNVARRSDTGRARTVTLGIGKKTVSLSGSEFVRRVGQRLGWNRLKSNWFDVEMKGSTFHFRGRGFGHGVGFCQSGADGMARAGFSHGKILRHYFPGVEIAGNE
jgi:stage II sporulation protein D